MFVSAIVLVRVTMEEVFPVCVPVEFRFAAWMNVLDEKWLLVSGAQAGRGGIGERDTPRQR